MKTLNQNDIGSFIRYDLQDKLERDFCGRPFRIFQERDLHACTYFHLRRFIRADHQWEILNEPFLRGLKGSGKSAQPDLVFLRRGKPVLLVELKFRRRVSGVQRKDQTVLKKAVKRKKWVKKAYYIETVVQLTRTTRRGVSLRRNRVVTIVMRNDRLGEYLHLFKQRRKPAPRTARSKCHAV